MKRQAKTSTKGFSLLLTGLVWLNTAGHRRSPLGGLPSQVSLLTPKGSVPLVPTRSTGSNKSDSSCLTVTDRRTAQSQVFLRELPFPNILYGEFLRLISKEKKIPWNFLEHFFLSSYQLVCDMTLDLQTLRLGEKWNQCHYSSENYFVSRRCLTLLASRTYCKLLLSGLVVEHDASPLVLFPWVKKKKTS